MSEGGEGGPRPSEISDRANKALGPGLEQISDEATRKATNDAFREMMKPPQKVKDILQRVDEQIEIIDQGDEKKTPHRARRRKTFLSRKYKPRESESHEKFKTKYTPKERVGEQNTFPDRQPELDPKISEEFAKTVNDILDRVEDKPETATFEDLSAIIEADKTDMKKQGGSYDRLQKALVVAKESFKNRNNPRTVNVSLAQNKNGIWEANPGAKEGELYFTFTPTRIIELRNQIQFYHSTLDTLDYAQASLDKIMDKKGIAENGSNPLALYGFLREKINLLEAGRKATTNPDMLKKAEDA